MNNFLLQIIFLAAAFPFFSEGQEGIPDWFKTPKQVNEDFKKGYWPHLSPKEEKLREKLWNKTWEQYQTPIEFYGKIIDEDGHPVVKAYIKFLVVDGSEKGLSEYSAYSNTEGEFKLNNVKGKSLNIEIVDNRYYISKKNEFSYEYADLDDPNYFEPKSRDPIVFKTKKRGISEPLISERNRWILDVAGEPLYIDLLANLKLARQDLFKEADLLIRFEKEPSSTREDPKWTLCLEVPGSLGGLIISREEYMFRAPDKGYQKELRIKPGDFPASEIGRGSIYLFLRSREGKHHARLKIKVGFTYGNMLNKDTGYRQEVEALWIQYFMNPKSSTNLEYERGNLIVANLQRDHVVNLIYPTVDELAKMRQEVPMVNVPEPDSIARSIDPFGD